MAGQEIALAFPAYQPPMAITAVLHDRRSPAGEAQGYAEEFPPANYQQPK